MLSCKRSKHQPFEKHFWLGINPLYTAFFLLPSLVGHVWPDLPGLLPPVLHSFVAKPTLSSFWSLNSMPKHREGGGGRSGRSRHMNDVNVCSGTLRVGGVLTISRGFFLECVRALETQMFMKLKIWCPPTWSTATESWSRGSWCRGSWSHVSWCCGSWSHASWSCTS